MIDKLTSLIMEAMGSAIKPIVSEELSDGTIKSLYETAKNQDMVHLVGSAILKYAKDFPENEYFKKFKKQFMIAVLRYEKLQYLYNEITDLFEKEKIPFLPLKGSVIRRYYPEPWMRTSCDIDILIHEQDLERAQDLITDVLHLTPSGRTRHDVSFDAANGVHFELHHSLIEDNVLDKADLPLTRVWDYTKSTEGKTYEHELSPEMFYYYHIAHMAKHFVNGGCGMRPFLDIHVFRKNVTFDEAIVKALLTEGGLLTFAEKAETLSKVWFESLPHTDLTKAMEVYLLEGGTYGTIESYVAMQQKKRGGKLRYLFSRFFLSFESLATIYPSLKKHRWLYPIFQVRRWFRLLLPGKMKRSMHEFKINQNTSNDSIAAAGNLLKELEL